MPWYRLPPSCLKLKWGAVETVSSCCVMASTMVKSRFLFIPHRWSRQEIAVHRTACFPFHRMVGMPWPNFAVTPHYSPRIGHFTASKTATLQCAFTSYRKGICNAKVWRGPIGSLILGDDRVSLDLPYGEMNIVLSIGSLVRAPPLLQLLWQTYLLPERTLSPRRGSASVASDVVASLPPRTCETKRGNRGVTCQPHSKTKYNVVAPPPSRRRWREKRRNRKYFSFDGHYCRRRTAIGVATWRAPHHKSATTIRYICFSLWFCLLCSIVAKGEPHRACTPISETIWLPEGSSSAGSPERPWATQCLLSLLVHTLLLSNR